MHINEIVTSLIAAGGLGFINYFVADELDLIEFDDTSSKTLLPFLLLWSSVDYIIYLLASFIITLLQTFVNVFFKNFHIVSELKMSLSLILAIVLIFLFSEKCSKPIFDFIRDKTNKQRNKDNKTNLFNGNALNKVFSSNDYQAVYIYDFEKKFITKGHIKSLSQNNGKEILLALRPFTNDNGLPTEYSEIKLKTSEKNFLTEHKTMEIVDFQNKLIIITIVLKN